jgi:hypothetical protein
VALVSLRRLDLYQFLDVNGRGNAYVECNNQINGRNRRNYSNENNNKIRINMWNKTKSVCLALHCRKPSESFTISRHRLLMGALDDLSLRCAFILRCWLE